MTKALEMILLAVGTIITCVTVSVHLYSVRDGTQRVSSKSEMIYEVFDEAGSYEYTQWNGKTVIGETVNSFVAANATMKVVIKTGKKQSGFQGSAIEFFDDTSDYYVNPTAFFECSVELNKHNDVEQVVFTQNKRLI